jgi:hypothetical protein
LTCLVAQLITTVAAKGSSYFGWIMAVGAFHLAI